MKLATTFVVLSVLIMTGMPDASADKLSEARDLMDRGMNYSAATTLEELTVKDEDNHEAWALLGECYLKIEDLDNAYSAVVTALDLVKDKNAEYWKLLGRVSFAKGEAAIRAKASAGDIKLNYADAQVKFEKALAMKPDDPDVVWRIGQAFEWQEYANNARKAYEEQVAKFPKAPEGYLRLGALIASEATRIGNGQTPEAKAHRAKAIKLFEDGLSKAGPNSEILYNLGMAYEWDREREKAKACYFRAMRADSECNKAWKRLFEAYKVPASELAPVGREIFEKHPTSTTVATWLGFFLRSENKPEEALDLLMPVLKHHREAGDVYGQAFASAMALLFPKSGGPVKRKPEIAVAALVKIHEYYPWFGSAANNVGLYYRDNRPANYRKSLEWYLKASEREPGNQDILNDTGLIFLFHSTGSEQKKCLSFFETVLSLVEDDGQKPERGYWDSLENLCKYYWEVDRKPELVVKYAKMRYEVTDGVKPYNMSGTSAHYGKVAEKALNK